MTIKPTRRRILVSLLPATLEHTNILKLTLVDRKKHFDHSSRKGVVEAVGFGVTQSIQLKDVVVFRGDAGFSLDGDPEVDRAEYGEGFRWLKETDVMAVEEAAPALLEASIR